MENEFIDRLKQVERKYKKLKIKFISFSVVCFALFFGFAFKQFETFDIISAKGIIIEDEFGIDRILIGSTVPYSKNRVKADSSLVRDYSAKKHTSRNQFTEWDSNYKHNEEGIIIMNEKGFERVDKFPDEKTDKRQFDVAGKTWNENFTCYILYFNLDF